MIDDPEPSELISDSSSADTSEMPDPKTGKLMRTKDMCEEFARMLADVDRDPEAERAFVDSKIAMIRNHSVLTEADKVLLIAELEKKFKGKQ